MELLSVLEFNLIYNSFSFTFAVMAAATLFFWLNLGSVAPSYRPALVITGLVTFIAAYHYFQIFTSFDSAFTVTNDTVAATGKPFNNAYRYVDWLLTVPLLMVELILVMKLSKAETYKRAWTLGLAAALMIVLGYPGEISADAGTRWLWWTLSMIPFVYIVGTLFFGLTKSIEDQPAEAKSLVNKARWIVILTWSFYPIVFMFPMLGLTGGTADVAVEVGYSIADILAKAGFGVIIYMIARRKSEAEGYTLS
jgi:bacteriorhodopsin